MSTDEQYNGWANRETWAFWLHVNNDQGLQEHATELVREAISSWPKVDGGSEAGDWYIGEALRDGFMELYDEAIADGIKRDHTLALMREDVGSWWRVNVDEIGAHARELLEDDTL